MATYKPTTLHLERQPGVRKVNRAQLSMLPPKALDMLATELDSLARTVQGAAADARRSQARNQELDRRILRIESAADMAACYMLNGMTADQAVHTACVQTGLEPDALNLALPKARKALARLERQKRNRTIMQMVAGGKTDTEIGDYFDLHRVTVNRIVAKERKRGR